jgi:hypothetical protein
MVSTYLYMKEMDLSFNILHYYIDRCELWRFIREINVRYQLFLAGTTFAQL